MATRVIDDTKLQNIAVAIQSKDNGGQMTVDEMAGRIDNIMVAPAPVQNPALILWDWEGTKLAEYSAEDVLAFTELPAPSTLPAYADVDHDLMVFQEWNWSLADIKTWAQEHRNTALDIEAFYTTTDGQNHNYFITPRTTSTKRAYKAKLGDASALSQSIYIDAYPLTYISIPVGITSLGGNIFLNAFSLMHIGIPNSVVSIWGHTFGSCRTCNRIILPGALLRINNGAFASCLSIRKICLPYSLTIIGEQSFYECSSLSEIAIPNGVTTIGNQAFYNCHSMPKINIPKTTESIGDSAFSHCFCLYDILNESKAALANANAFDRLPSQYRIYVPRADLSWFETETNWSTIYTQGHIVAIEDHIEYLESIGFNVDAYKEAA